MSDEKFIVPSFSPSMPSFRALNEAQQQLAKIGQEKNRRERTIADAAAAAMRAASVSVDQLIGQLEEFQQGLTETEELALVVVGGPAGMSFFPTGLVAIDPDKIVFIGVDQDGRSFRIIQHVSQLNVAMQAMPVEPNEEPRRIQVGFHHPLDE